MSDNKNRRHWDLISAQSELIDIAADQSISILDKIGKYFVDERRELPGNYTLAGKINRVHVMIR